MKPFGRFSKVFALTTFSIVLDLSNRSEASMEDKICDNTVAVSERDIIHFIFANYSKEARPRKNASESVEVTLSFRIRAIHDLVEKDNTLILDAYIYSNWVDEYLGWNFMFPFSCFSQLVLPPASTWTPDVSLINAPNGIYSLMLAPGFSIYLSSDGAVEYAPGGQVITTCEVDVSYFPFDRQVCQVNFEAWNYDTTQQYFKLDEKHAFVKVDSSWTENRQWAVEANYSRIRLVTYLEGSYYSHASFTLVLRRKSLYYYVNIIAPSIIISVVEMATFALPIHEVIKIHISFTCLLAYSVFQGMVIADLPRSGDTVPLLSLYIDLQMSYIGIIALMGEAVVFTIIQKGQKEQDFPPAKLFAVFRIIGRIARVHDRHLIAIPAKKPSAKKRDDKQDDDFQYSFFKLSNSNFTYGVEPNILIPSSQVDGKESTVDSSKSTQGEPSPSDKLQHWIYIAEVIARINLILYMTAISATPLVMFLMLPGDDIEKRLANI